jgi:hypothetical protein
MDGHDAELVCDHGLFQIQANLLKSFVRFHFEKHIFSFPQQIMKKRITAS